MTTTAWDDRSLWSSETKPERPQTRPVEAPSVRGGKSLVEVRYEVVAERLIQKVNFQVLPERERERFESFLRTLAVDRPVVAGAIRVAWSQILSKVVGAPLPIVVPGEDEEALELLWRSNSQNLSLEVTEEGLYHWFFRDREKNLHEGTSEPVQNVPPSFLVRLRNFR